MKEIGVFTFSFPNFMHIARWNSEHGVFTYIVVHSSEQSVHFSDFQYSIAGLSNFNRFLLDAIAAESVHGSPVEPAGPGERALRLRGEEIVSWRAGRSHRPRDGSRSATILVQFTLFR